jgi:hypothetical protein
MNPIVLLLAAIGAAYLASRLSRRGPFSPADFAIGLVGGLVSMSMSQFFGAASAGWGPGLALLVACGLAIGLQSLQRRSPLR